MAALAIRDFPLLDWHRIGAGGLVASHIVMGLAAVSAKPAMRPGGWVWLAGTFLAIGVIYLLVHRYSASGWLLVWPAAGLIRLASFGVVDHPAAQLVTGLITIFFLYAGLTQPQGRSSWLLPPALLVLRGLIDLPLSSAWVRLVIAALVWSLAAELPALLLQRLARQHNTLQVTAATDSLTGARNRHGLAQLLHSRYGHAFLIILDLDHFKAYNDTHGHVAGDQVLADFAAMLARDSRRADVVIRYGGEEFLILLPDVDAASAQHIMDRWRRTWHHHASGTTFSGGATDLDGESALHRADGLLYQAKAAGRNRTAITLSSNNDTPPPPPNGPVTDNHVDVEPESARQQR